MAMLGPDGVNNGELEKMRPLAYASNKEVIDVVSH